jgi:glycosyltransferase involved in cell wall biosynthesis
MRLGVAIEETWEFFREIYDDLNAYHEVDLFKRRQNRLPFLRERTNRAIFRRDLEAFMHKNDLVFFEWASELLVHASRLPKSCRIVTRLHRYELYQWADQINWEAVDRIILVSKAKHNEFIRKFPAQASKIIVIPEAISLGRFQFMPKPFNGDIGILCNLSPRKRVYELVLAFSELTRGRDDFHLHIGGGKHTRYPEYNEIVQQLVERLGLNDKVTFYGRVTDPQDWYHKIDIFISNSYSEGLQVSPMEAMASGCYCLSHRWDGADELLPDECLFYTDGEMLDKILEYAGAGEEERISRIGKLRLMVSQNFNVDQTKVCVRKTIEDVYKSGGVRGI